MALDVLERLRQAGHQAYFAGGCVRDMLMGHEPADYDVATDATPKEVQGLFRHVLLVGAQFGVAMVIRNRRKVEVTTFRSDVSYSDGRRPDDVRFSTPREDALRRDFTINGMFCDPIAEEVIDYVGGREDLQRGVIRTIGDPEQRFSEDYLRMLRAVRFAVRFGFDIDNQTAEAIRRHAPKIASISGERIFDELSKMLSLDSAGESLDRLDELTLAEAILPELVGRGPDRRQLWRRAATRVREVARHRDDTLAIAALLAELPERAIRRIVRRWGASNELRDVVILLARRRGDWPTAADLPQHEFKRLLADRNWERLVRLWQAEERLETGRQERTRAIARRADDIPAERIAPDPLVGGDDLKGLGVRPGPHMGDLLRRLYDAQLDERITTRDEAMELAERLVGEAD